ncbi:hypothetical protein MAP00_009064 [Monascus purpureus]|nr:hypothetical protein MAP00_009064 [Monascus purpureus]
MPLEKRTKKKNFSAASHNTKKRERMYHISLAQKYRDDLMTQENNNDARMQPKVNILSVLFLADSSVSTIPHHRMKRRVYALPTLHERNRKKNILNNAIIRTAQRKYHRLLAG